MKRRSVGYGPAIDALAVERLALKRLILDLAEWSRLPQQPTGWLCEGLRKRVEEAIADLPKQRLPIEVQEQAMRLKIAPDLEPPAR